MSISIVESIPASDSVNIRVIRAGKGDEDRSSQDSTTVTPTEPVGKSLSTSSKPMNKKSNIDKVTREIVRFFVEYPDENLNELCEKYLRNLIILVDECEQHFNNPN